MIGDIHHFQVGQLQCANLCDAYNPGDEQLAKNLFPNIATETVMQAADESGAPFVMCINLLLIRSAGQTILIDTGLGGESSQLLDMLQKEGVDPADITRVIITHCHRDHIGGLVGDDGALTFPNARYSMGQIEWDYWMGEIDKSDDPQMAQRVKLLPIEDHLDIFEPDAEITPGVCAVFAPGHTVGQMALPLESNGERMLHMADTAHLAFQAAHPDWSPTFDKQPDVAAQTRYALFERAARENLLLMGYHLPWPALGHVTMKGDAFSWQPR
ncbi:MAG: MBL fold metallo-hydrolase [Burkholderiales bacterium]|nr:MBL fold metallo-hydrolase [Anaerolineae bacterium]